MNITSTPPMDEIDMKYISSSVGGYIIRKTRDQHTDYYGFYTTLSHAVHVRDLLVRAGFPREYSFDMLHTDNMDYTIRLQQLLLRR